MRELIKHRSLGITFVAVMVLGVWLVYAIFTQ